MREAKVLVIGHSCLDSVAVADEAAPPDGKLEARRIWTGPGGPAANAAIALRRLGHDVTLLTRIGDDAPGRLVTAALQAEGIRLPSTAVDGGTTSLAQIRAVGPDRSVVWRRGQLPPLEADPRSISVEVEAADLVYVDGHETGAATVALEHARRLQRLTVADLGNLRTGAEDWPGLLDCAVATPRWLERRFPSATTIGEALDALAREAGSSSLVGVTLGARGGFAIENGRRLDWIARKTGVVDTTVAGDAFHAGLADGLLQEMDARSALDWAATLAAAVCRAPGNSALPADRDQLALWHGRWGHRPAPDPALLGRALRPDQGTATR